MCTRHHSIPLATLFSLWLLFVMGGTATAHGSVSTHPTLPAHAKVYKAIPTIGSTIAQAPTTVTVFTLENINPDPKKSNLFVYGPSGDLMSQGNARVALNNPREMSIAIKADGNGIYVVRWITVSAEDGDPDEGAFVFTVKPGGTAQPSTGHRTTTIAAGPGGMPLWVPIVAGILALLIGLGGGFVLGRRDAISPVRTMRRKVAEQEQQEEDLPTKGTS
jgi:methionine-rich copper-binding protein CopC